MIPYSAITTQQILSERSPHSFYPSENEEEFKISSKNCWTDTQWIFDGKRAGANYDTVTIKWDVGLHDGSSLCNPAHSVLLSELRYLSWSLYIDRRNGYPIAPSNAGNLSFSLKWLANWMVRNNYKSISELNDRAAERYVDWLIECVINEENDENASSHNVASNEVHQLEDINAACSEDDNEDIEFIEDYGISSRNLRAYLSVWSYLWQQRDALLAIGVKSIQCNPFPGKTIQDICRKISTKVASKIPALPDVVAIAIMNAAHRFITVAAKDMLRITPFLMKEIASQEYQTCTIEQKPLKIKNLVSDLRFSIPEGEEIVWHPPLKDFKEPISKFRALLDDLVEACIIIIQSETGMRLGEIASLAAGINSSTGLAACIDVRPSKSGMLDLYYLRANLSKGRKTAIQEEWLLAARPCNSTTIPNVVHAVQILQELLAPFREFASAEAKKSLLITLLSRNLPVQETSIGPASNQKIRLGLKTFAEKYVNWDTIADDAEVRPYKITKGFCLRTHQWRKTFAQYVFQVDRRLLPAIALQFKHLSLAMTEGAYIGTNFNLVSDIANHNRNMTVDLLLLNARGIVPKQEGRLAKLMAEYQPKMAKIIEGMDEHSARETLGSWCDSRKLKLFFHGYGKCIPALAPTEAECHKRAQTVHWANTKPNYSAREPSVCTGCYLFLASQETIIYWQERYIENMQFWIGAKDLGKKAEYRVAKARADQSAAYLSVLGVPLPEIEA